MSTAPSCHCPPRLLPRAPGFRRRLRAWLIGLCLLLPGAVGAQEGILDPAYGIGLSGVNATLQSMALQPNGRLLIGGNFTTVNGAAHVRMARLNANGTVDTSFSVGSLGIDDFVNAIVLQPDGRILIGGNFTSVNGVPRRFVARLNANGTLDTSFGANLPFLNNRVFSMALLPDGRILIGGTFNTVNGQTPGGIARLNSDGSLDTSFTRGLGFNTFSGTFAIAVQGNGRIVIGGAFTEVQGVARGNIARLNANGTLDSSFGNGLAGLGGSSFPPVQDLRLQPDGRVLVGGQFTSVNGVARRGIARLNTDGSLDTSFADGLSGTNGQVLAVDLRSDGKILIAGDFTSVHGSPRGRIARLSANGSLDSGFGSGLSGASARINAMQLQPADGRILIGGIFFTLNDQPRGSLGRLVGTAFTVGGSVSGLNGAGLVLRNNGGDDLPVTGNGAFVFPRPVASTAVYLVSVASQPAGQFCTVSNGNGAIAAANITQVNVACVANVAPVAVDDRYTVLEDRTLSIAAPGVLGNDTDGDAANVLRVEPVVNAPIVPLSGNLDGQVGIAANGALTYTPGPNRNGSGSVVYAAFDGFVASATPAQVRIEVTAVNDAPDFRLVDIAEPAGTSGQRVWPGFVKALSFGPPDEANQAVETYLVGELSDPGQVVSDLSLSRDGTLSYQLADVPTGGTATFQVQARDDGGTDNGGVNLSPPRTFRIVLQAGSDLGLVIDNGADLHNGGSIVDYTIAVANAGPLPVSGARVQTLLASQLTPLNWTCTASGGATCAQASGSGTLDALVDLPVNATARFDLAAQLAAQPEGLFTATATVTAPAPLGDRFPDDNTQSDTDVIGVFADGFEDSAPE
jgi:uncharacterized delta-60 repeat protein/uncharacterized repeat protein (TIGR01451 family)